MNHLLQPSIFLSLLHTPKLPAACRTSHQACPIATSWALQIWRCHHAVKMPCLHLLLQSRSSHCSALHNTPVSAVLQNITTLLHFHSCKRWRSLIKKSSPAVISTNSTLTLQDLCQNLCLAWSDGKGESSLMFAREEWSKYHLLFASMIFHSNHDLQSARSVRPGWRSNQDIESQHIWLDRISDLAA